MRGMAFARLAMACALLSQTGPVHASGAPSDVTVRMGETWIFQLKDNRPVNARKAGADEKPATGDLVVTLSEAGGQTMMRVVNNTPEFINYHAFLIAAEGQHAKTRTSVCTLLSNGRSAFESWPYPVAAVQLTDFAKADEGQMSCQ